MHRIHGHGHEHYDHEGREHRGRVVGSWDEQSQRLAGGGRGNSEKCLLGAFSRDLRTMLDS